MSTRVREAVGGDRHAATYRLAVCRVIVRVCAAGVGCVAAAWRTREVGGTDGAVGLDVRDEFAASIEYGSVAHQRAAVCTEGVERRKLTRCAARPPVGSYDLREETRRGGEGKGGGAADGETGRRVDDGAIRGRRPADLAVGVGRGGWAICVWHRVCGIACGCTSEMTALGSIEKPARAAREHGERGCATEREKERRLLRRPASCRAAPSASSEFSSTLSTCRPSGSPPAPSVAAWHAVGGGAEGACCG
jgi:hypothetical protein